MKKLEENCRSNPNEAPSDDSTAGARPIMFYQYPVEYLGLLQRNSRYRLYLLSHICQHIGDWYIRIASLLLVDRLAPNSATAVSAILIAKMVPQISVSHLGGALADSLDRRKLMMALDILGALVTLGFLIAIQTSSLSIFYVVTAMRAAIHSLYEPITKSIVPMICNNKEDLKRANTLNGMVWSLMVAVGGVVAGATSAYLGMQACYVIDSATYFISAAVLSFLKGEYIVLNDGTTIAGPVRSGQHHTPLSRLLSPLHAVANFFRMVWEVILYLSKSDFGLLVFMKASGSLAWGSADVLNVEFSHLQGDEVGTSKRLGLIFSFIGMGCLFGPMSANYMIDAERPATMQLACVVSLAFVMLAWIGFAQDPPFTLVCVFTSLRACGSSTIWVNASLLLQNLSSPQMLGRVLALEFACCMFFDALAATAAGRVLDRGFPKHAVSAGAAGIAATLFVLWSSYHMFGQGAAQKRFNSPHVLKTRLAEIDSA